VATLSVEAAAYFTVCEALTNVAKYARATRAWVNVGRRDGHLDAATCESHTLERRRSRKPRI
jgi:hypothetical protein